SHIPAEFAKSMFSLLIQVDAFLGDLHAQHQTNPIKDSSVATKHRSLVVCWSSVLMNCRNN
ncbi:MAG: hypothetical protein ACRC9V_11475, partial [Aeromonas sp.]